MYSISPNKKRANIVIYCFGDIFFGKPYFAAENRQLSGTENYKNASVFWVVIAGAINLNKIWNKIYKKLIFRILFNF